MGFFDVLLDAVDGAMTGKGNSFGAQLGKAFRQMMKKTKIGLVFVNIMHKEELFTAFVLMWNITEVMTNVD